MAFFVERFWLFCSVLTISSKQENNSLSSVVHNHSASLHASIPATHKPTADEVPLPHDSEDVILSCRPISKPELVAAGDSRQTVVADGTSPSVLSSDGFDTTDATSSGSVSCQLSSSERQWVEKVFHVFAVNQEGKLCEKRLGSVLEKLGVGIRPENVSSLVDSLNVKVPGYLDVEEFLLLYNDVCASLETLSDPENSEEKDLFDTFLVFDKNRDGFISCDELQEVFSTLGFKEGENARMCQDMINRFDEDGDGKVNFLEFKAMMSRSAS